MQWGLVEPARSLEVRLQPALNPLKELPECGGESDRAGLRSVVAGGALNSRRDTSAHCSWPAFDPSMHRHQTKSARFDNFLVVVFVVSCVLDSRCCALRSLFEVRTSRSL